MALCFWSARSRGLGVSSWLSPGCPGGGPGVVEPNLGLLLGALTLWQAFAPAQREGCSLGGRGSPPCLPSACPPGKVREFPETDLS